MASRGKRRRDPRTEQQKVVAIAAAIHGAGDDGICPGISEQGKRESAQRVLARTVQIPQREIIRLMPRVVEMYGELYPGHRPFINNSDKNYLGSDRHRPGDLVQIATRLTAAATKTKRGIHELDVDEAEEEAVDLREEAQAVSVLLSGLAKRSRNLAASHVESTV
jgi:hypothetical protein